MARIEVALVIDDDGSSGCAWGEVDLVISRGWAWYKMVDNSVTYRCGDL